MFNYFLTFLMMKKIIPAFLLSFILLTSSAQAFWWDMDRDREMRKETYQDIWNDPFFDDPFFSYHRNFMNRWHSNLSDFSFPKISMANNYPLDLEEQEDQFVATIDIPHFGPADIEIEVKNDRWLIVQGKKEAKDESENEGKKYYYRERSSGSFARQILLPHPVDKSATEAKYKDGTFTITLPKKSVEPISTDTIPIITD